MTLGQFSLAVGAGPRWVQNARAVLNLPPRYTVTAARRLSLTRTLKDTYDLPLVEAYAMAREALAGWPSERQWVRDSPDGAVRLIVELERFLSGFTARLSLAHTLYAERARGRPGKKAPRGLERARQHGVDLGLLDSSLRRTPGERLRSLDRDLDFLRSLRVARRGSQSPRSSPTPRSSPSPRSSAGPRRLGPGRGSRS